MGKYRHKVTGAVREYRDSYARVISALEPVSDDEQETPLPCGPCGAAKSTGVDAQTDVEYAEPYEYDLGE